MNNLLADLLRMRYVSDSVISDPDRVSASEDQKAQVLDAVERAKALKLCLRRIWAVAASLPGRENSLPGLIPVPGTFPIPGHDREQHEHEQCTFDFCEQSRIDFTSVAQHHESPCPGNCDRLIFPLQLLDGRVANRKSTAWRLDEPSLLETSLPYMAISHVWSDGTGSGTWGYGKVNKCLYTFFSSIARSFQCEGCWWDSISIPLDEKARSAALSAMHLNYSNSRVTLVHDLYLREWDWVNAETACFAIVMSPWYSRGWTALELAQSHKVKILFKARNDDYVIKDLDIDILAEVPESHTTANAIRKLRHTTIDEFSSLLAILGARDTSKPRDVPIISGLLAGVDVSGGLSQQGVYQRILRKMGRVAQGHLFHNSATMSTAGFSWCPTNILDMPMAEIDSPMLQLRENGDLEGAWKVKALDNIKIEDLITKGTHPLTQVSLESAFLKKNMDKHVLLLETNEPRTTSNDRRAILVKLMESADKILAKFVGPVYFRTTPTSGMPTDEELPYIQVRIGSTDGRQDIHGKAWDYVKKRVAEQASSRHETPSQDRASLDSKSVPPLNDNDDVFPTSEDWRAILVMESEVGRSLLDEQFQIQLTKDPKSETKDGMAMSFYRCVDFMAKPSPRSFFYGNKKMVPYVQTWLNENPKSMTEKGQLKLLAIRNGNVVILDPLSEENTRVKSSLLGQALLIVAEKAKTSGVDTRSTDSSRMGGIDMRAVVQLLLDINAPHLCNAVGQTPLHIAIGCDNYSITDTLLRNKVSPALVDKKDEETQQTALHLAAGRKTIPSAMAELLAKESKNRDAQDELNKRTALHYAADSGNIEMAKALLNEQATRDTCDSEQRVALHYAAEKGHVEIVKLLLKPPKVPSDSTIAQETEVEANEEPNGTTGDSLNAAMPSDSEKGVTDKAAEIVTGADDTYDNNVIAFDPNIKDFQGQTPLHLAAKNGHEAVVLTLLNYNANACAVPEENQTPLQLAAKNGHSRIVKILLASKGVVFHKEELNYALLMAAVAKDEDTVREILTTQAGSTRNCLFKDMTALQWIIKAGFQGSADLLIGKQQNPEPEALLMASEQGWTDTVKLLLKKGADITQTDSTGKTALHLAAAGPFVGIVQELVNLEDERLVNVQDNQKRTALHLAVGRMSIPVTKLIVDTRYHHYLEDKDGRTVLVKAAEMGLDDIVKILIDRGSDPARGDKGMTALERAAALGHDAVVLTLLSKFEAEDDLKERALNLAAKAGHLSVALFLNNKIKNTALKSSTLRTIIFAAAAKSRDNSVSFEKYITDANVRNDKGQSLLMVAIQSRHRELVRYLWSLSPNIDLQDKDDKTALMVAAIKNDSRMVSALLDHGANQDLKDKNGYTALHHVVENGRFESFIEFVYFRSDELLNTIQDSQNRSALHIALYKYYQARLDLPRAHVRHMEICAFLIRRGIRPETQDDNRQNALHLAVNYKLKDMVRLLLNWSELKQSPRVMDSKDVEGQTPMLLAAGKGYTDLVHLMLEKGFDPDTGNNDGQTSLLLTAERGDDESVKALLQCNANPNLRDKHGRTALSQAAQNGHEDVVSSLLHDDHCKKTTLNGQDKMGRTALLLAAENGHANIVKSLVEKKANVDIVGYDKKKAWQKAVDKGHALVVKSLLSSDNASIQDRQAINEALLLASKRGWVDLVEVLLCQEVDLTFQSSGDEWTALHMAAMGGHQEVLKLLIEKGVDIVIKDRNGRTALFLATEQGFKSCVEELLKKEEIINDIEAWMGQDSLLFAAEKGYDDIARLLLNHRVNCDSTDASGRTAVLIAATNGKGEIVKMLLKSGASSSIKDKNQRTALHHAAWRGHHDIAETLLAHKPTVTEGSSMLESSVVESSLVDTSGHSALHLAAERAAIQTVETLVKNKANVNAICNDGQTVLHRAAWGGSLKVINLLRSNGADPSVRDKQHKKPWHIAAEKGHEAIAVQLLYQEESVFDERIQDENALIFAAKMGYTSIAECLLKKNAQATVKDRDGVTPLHWAAARGEKKLVEMLINHGEVSIDAMDTRGCTALSLAVQDGHTASVEILLQCGTNTNIRDTHGQTALHHAAERGNEIITQLLIDHNVDPHIHDNHRRKAWQLAAAKGYHQVVRLLLDKETDILPHNDRREELYLEMSRRNLVPIVQLLLELEVDKDAKDRLGRTAIGLAAENGADDVFRLLLSKKADLSITDSRRQTPLLWAAKAGNAKMISLLLDNITQYSHDDKKREIVNQDDAEGRTALMIAVENKHDKCVKLLLEKCRKFIDVNVQDKMQRNAIQMAAEIGNNTWVQLLLERDAELDPKDILGRTALLLAIENGHTQVAKALLKKDNDPVNIADNQGRTPLQAAADLGNGDMVQALLIAHADPLAQDDRSRTALLLAVEHGDEANVKLLLNKIPKEGHTDQDMGTPLLMAVANGDKAVVEALIRRSDADLGAKDRRDRSLLDVAVDSGNKDVLYLVATMVTERRREKEKAEREKEKKEREEQEKDKEEQEEEETEVI